jgi:hypothetical protein
MIPMLKRDLASFTIRSDSAFALLDTVDDAVPTDATDRSAAIIPGDDDEGAAVVVLFVARRAAFPPEETDAPLLFLPPRKNLERNAELLDFDTAEFTVDSSWESSDTESDTELSPPAAPFILLSFTMVSFSLPNPLLVLPTRHATPTAKSWGREKERPSLYRFFLTFVSIVY